MIVLTGKNSMVAFNSEHVIVITQRETRLFISFVDGSDLVVWCDTPEKAQEVFKAVVYRTPAVYEIQDYQWGD